MFEWIPYYVVLWFDSAVVKLADHSLQEYLVFVIRFRRSFVSIVQD